MRYLAPIGSLWLLFVVAGCGGDSSSAVCGNGVCDSGESSSTCCSDCGCTGGLICQGGACVAAGPATRCGNGVCESGESSSNCCSDCGCPGTESCTNGSCVAPVCMQTGTSCTTDQQCCDYQQSNGYCVNFGSGGLCADSCHQNSDCKSNCCQTTNQGDQVCSPSSFCTSLVPGAPCTVNAECSSGLCVNGGSGQGWCSETCTSDGACPNSPFLMWCGQNSGGSDICWTNCASNSDCAKYGPSASCTAITTINGVSAHVCTG